MGTKLDWFLGLFSRDGFRPAVPVKEVDPVFDALAIDHTCPDCGGEEFNMGPQGGMSQHIKCSNVECGSEFCVAPFEDGEFLDTPMVARRTNRSEAESISVWGRGYGNLHYAAQPEPANLPAV